METLEKNTITIETLINAPVEKVWQFWTEPAHITKWCAASGDWHAPHAENDVRTDGKFKTTMAARDGSVSFDFEGVYTRVDLYKNIEYAITDGRKVKIDFTRQGNQTKVVETFEAENENPLELQRSGWQSILDNFKSYVEKSK